MKEVIVFFGGESSERLVSVASAQNVSSSLKLATLWFQHPTGEVSVVSHASLAAHERPFENPYTPPGAPAFRSAADAFETLKRDQHIVFIALHGGKGEDGMIQRLLEMRGIAFTGSGSDASRKAFNKVHTKQIVSEAKGRVALGVSFAAASAEAHEPKLRELFQRAKRWVLKPEADGSSSGLVHLISADQCAAAAKTMAALNVPYLAEPFIEGREITIGVVDGTHGLEALPPSEVKLETGAAFDYQGKYLGRGTVELTPAPITDAEKNQVQQLALLAHRAVGCFGYSRTDTILTPDGPVFLEINTLPGLTKASFIPQQLAAAHKLFGNFLEQQLNLARTRALRAGLGPENT